MIRLIVAGAAGRMGQRILDLAGRNPSIRIAGALENPAHPGIGGKIMDGKAELTGDLAALKGAADVMTDFTSPKATLAHLKTVRNWKRFAVVIGTTGFSKAELAQIKTISRKIPIVLSPNMSVGVNLLFDLARLAAAKLSRYDIEIVEAHHNQKKDAPSGTALALAREIADELKRNPDRDFVYGREGNTGARKPGEIGIHAVRAGDIVGDHTVTFAAPGERIELTHRASSRDALASGAVLAALWLAKRKPGLYSMKDVLR